MHSRREILKANVEEYQRASKNTVKSGFFAFDTVAHCGGSTSGQFCKTLTGTDVFSGWIEERSLLNAANHWDFEAFSDIHSTLPCVRPLDTSGSTPPKRALP
jgi:hypothetical protein